MAHAHAAQFNNTNATIIQQVLSCTPSGGHTATRADAIYANDDSHANFAATQRALSPNPSGGRTATMGEVVHANATVQLNDSYTQQNC
jgi:hypothetical protein